MYINERDEINYHGFLSALRLMQNATLKEVGTGICSESEIFRVELGERQPEKLMRDRISARLGVSSEEYEDYLNPEEYRQWMLRQYILKALDKKDIAEAERGIEEFEKIKKRNCVQEQFLETMHYILLQLKGASKEELLPVIERAILQTVPDIEAALDGAHLIADQEINLILEYIMLHEYCENPVEDMQQKLERCEKLLSVIESSYMDDIAKAKILPRIAGKMSEVVLALDFNEERLKHVIEICNNAIELLRKTSRLFCFIEVLECQSALLQKLKPYAYKKQMERNKEWIELFKELYADYDVPAYTETFCYFYWESECHNIVEVLEVRRGMTGLSRVKLADNICTDKTIIRYERNGISPTLSVTRDLFERMGLCAEYKRARVMTSSSETLYLANEVTEEMNNYKVEESSEKLEELKERLNMTIPFNQQELIVMETFLKQLKEEITEEEFYTNTLEALEKTIAFENVERNPKKYLTRSEITCMFHLAFETQGEKAEYCREYIEKLCMNILKRDMRVGRVPVYELIASGVADYLGDIGRFEDSTKLNNKMLKECLKYRRMYNLARPLYDNLWNMEELSKSENSNIDVQISKSTLKRCIILSRLNFEDSFETFFQQKLENINAY